MLIKRQFKINLTHLVHKNMEEYVLNDEIYIKMAVTWIKTMGIQEKAPNPFISVYISVRLGKFAPSQLSSNPRFFPILILHYSV